MTNTKAEAAIPANSVTIDLQGLRYYLQPEHERLVLELEDQPLPDDIFGKEIHYYAERMGLTPRELYSIEQRTRQFLILELFIHQLRNRIK